MFKMTYSMRSKNGPKCSKMDFKSLQMVLKCSKMVYKGFEKVQNWPKMNRKWSE